MSAGFSIGGLVSGIDTNSILSQLMEVERIPVRNMERQQADVQQSIDAWSGINTRVSALRDAAKGLDKLSDFATFVTSSSSSSAVTAVASGAADVGSISFTVDQLASQQQTFGDDVFTAGTDLVGTGTVSITIDGTQHDITTNSATSVVDLANAVNDLDVGVNASVVTVKPGEVRLMLTSADTGASAAFGMSVTDTNLTTFTDVADAANSIISFGGGAVQVERETNTVGDLISGVTLTLNQTTTNAVTVATSRDADAAVEALQSFVSELNSTIGTLAAATAFNPDTGGGPLSGSSAAREIVDGIRRAVAQPVDSLNGVYSYASSVGLEVQSNGTFVLDEAKLREAIADDFDAVSNLFAASASSTDLNVSFAGASSTTQAGTYAVNITQAAETATEAGAADGTVTSFDIVFGGKTASVALEASDDTADEVVAKINAALELADITGLAATAGTDPAFDLSTTAYGSAASFEIQNITGSAAGLASGTHSGQDVAGTIDGAAATGTGRTLKAVTGAASGLRLTITADAPGDLGTVDYSKGIAGTLSRLIDEIQDGETGTIANAKDSLQDRVDLYKERIERFEARLVLRQETLRRQFSAMESAIAQLQSSANFFAAQMGLQSQQ